MSTSTLQGKYRLAVQSGNKGYFGDVALDVEHGCSSGISPRKVPQLDAENALLIFPK